MGILNKIFNFLSPERGLEDGEYRCFCCSGVFIGEKGFINHIAKEGTACYKWYRHKCHKNKNAVYAHFWGNNGKTYMKYVNKVFPRPAPPKGQGVRTI